MSDVSKIKIGNDEYDIKDTVARNQIVDISGKADKVSGAVNGNFAGLDSNGNLTDSGSKASDFLGQFRTMPAATEENYGKVVQYIGADDNDLIHGYFYECTRAMGTQLYYWMNVSVSEVASYGHTILDSSGTAMNQRGKLQFMGATVTDDSANDKTIVTGTPQGMISDAWASGNHYVVGIYRIYNNTLYKCNTEHDSTASNYPGSSYGYWTAEKVGEALTSLNSGLEWQLFYESYTSSGDVNVDGNSPALPTNYKELMFMVCFADIQNRTSYQGTFTMSSVLSKSAIVRHLASSAAMYHIMGWNRNNANGWYYESIIQIRYANNAYRFLWQELVAGNFANTGFIRIYYR